jgi:hypothetical protein
MPSDPTGKTVTNPVQSRALPGSTEGLGLREFADRPRDIPKPKPLYLRAFLSGAMSLDSFFGQEQA